MLITRQLLESAFNGEPTSCATLDDHLRQRIDRLAPTVIKGYRPGLDYRDLAQGAFIHCSEERYRRLKKWDPERGTSYLDTVIRSSFYNELRRPAEMPTDPQEPTAQQRSVSPDQETALLEEEKAQRAMALINELPEDERALLRALLEEKSDRVLAAELGIQPGTLAQRRHRVISGLRKRLRKIFGD